MKKIRLKNDKELVYMYRSLWESQSILMFLTLTKLIVFCDLN